MRFRVLTLCLVAAACAAGLSASVPAIAAPPKNIIVMISDGCGYNQILATDYYQYGKAGTQVYEKFPVRLAVSTYSSKGSYDPKAAWRDFGYVLTAPTDSAAAATAMATGVKTYDAGIGVDTSGTRIRNVMEIAEARGKSTGVVTSVQWSHATPAGFVAHNANRGNYREIAQQMIARSAVDVIMGCGHPFFDGDGRPVEKPDGFDYVGGEETWKALVSGTAGGDANQDGVADPWTLIESRAQFRALTKGRTPRRVCGTAQVRGTLQQGRSGDVKAAPFAVPLTDSVPTLAEMVAGALNVLDNDPDGFVLMIEGGAVDWACHGNQSGRLIEEEMAFNKAVEAVSAWVKRHSSWEETLVIVTGDHETGYLSGPGSKPTWQPIVNNGAGKLPGMEWHSGGHTNSLVPLFARGAGSSLFREYADQHDPVRGRYMDNTEIAAVVRRLLE